MSDNFIITLIMGSFRDPILWIIAAVFASNIISKFFRYKLFLLSIAGIIWGFIRLYIYKSFGEVFTFNQTILLLLVCLLLMITIGIIFYFIFNLLKSNS
ncbi:MAG: hypothetical protein MKZ86_07435 [Alphaproteobacteria bacterium]|jgi:hypothetical protein|nr:hypothetical protein [Alphaproteobacteria bacterium]